MAGQRPLSLNTSGWIVEGRRTTRCRHRAKRHAAIDIGGSCRSDGSEEAPQRAGADGNLPLIQPMPDFEFDQRLSWSPSPAPALRTPRRPRAGACLPPSGCPRATTLASPPTPPRRHLRAEQPVAPTSPLDPPHRRPRSASCRCNDSPDPSRTPCCCVGLTIARQVFDLVRRSC